MKLFLDDIREAPDKTWVVVRSYFEFVEAVRKHGNEIIEISFDHDLGEDAHGSLAPTGMDAAKYFVDKFMIEEEGYGQLLLKVNVHSSNPAGRKNIGSYFESAKKHGLLNQGISITY